MVSPLVDSCDSFHVALFSHPSLTSNMIPGICCAYGDGFFKVRQNGVEVVTGGQFGSTAASNFGACPGEPDSPSKQPTSNPTSQPSPQPTQEPTAEPTTSQPTPEYTTCTETIFEVDVLTDGYPGETEWTLKNLCDGQIVHKSDPFSDGGMLYSKVLCLPDEEYSFTLTDSYGDGEHWSLIEHAICFQIRSSYHVCLCK